MWRYPFGSGGNRVTTSETRPSRTSAATISRMKSLRSGVVGLSSLTRLELVIPKRVVRRGEPIGLFERGLQAGEVRGAEDETVLGRDVDEIEVDAGACDPARQVGEDARTVVDLEHDDLALAADGEL